MGAANIVGTLQHINYTLEVLDLRECPGVSQSQKDRIAHLCDANRLIKMAYERFKNDIPAISLGLWPEVLARFETKPDLLFAVIKTKPDLFKERRAQRKRVRPELLRY